MAQPSRSRNVGKILSVAAAILFSVGGIYYGILLWDSFRMMRHAIRESDGGLVLVTEGITGRAVPYLIALALLTVFTVVQIAACFRPAWGMIASLSALAPILFPFFTDVALAEFTRVGLTFPVSMIKFIPFGIACLLWLLRGIWFPENFAGSGTKSP